MCVLRFVLTGVCYLNLVNCTVSVISCSTVGNYSAYCLFGCLCTFITSLRLFSGFFLLIVSFVSLYFSTV